jgi:hypothetical protein
VVGDGSYKTFTIPISEEQAGAVREEVGKIKAEPLWYNALRPDPRVCTTIVNRIAKAAGLGDDLLYMLPSRSMQYATDVESTLAANPKAKFMIDGAARPVRIPDALHDVQQDYASVGGGYDTPSERLGHGPDGPANFPSPSGSPSSRYAFSVYALAHSTPLPLQAEYMKSLGCGSACLFCVSLGFFISGNIPFGCLWRLGSLWLVSARSSPGRRTRKIAAERRASQLTNSYDKELTSGEFTYGGPWLRGGGENIWIRREE